MLRFNAEENLSAPSANYLAVYERHCGNMTESLRLFHIALSKAYEYTTTQEFSYRNRAAIAAELYARNIHVKDAEKALGLQPGRLKGFLIEQYESLDDCYQKQLVRLSLDLTINCNLRKIHEDGNNLPLSGKIILLEKYLDELSKSIYKEIKEKISTVTGESVPMFTGFSLFELRQFCSRVNKSLSSAGLAKLIQKIDLPEDITIERH